jgi:RNA polymerase sigma-70 factor (ECF subfamily)
MTTSEWPAMAATYVRSKAILSTAFNLAIAGGDNETPGRRKLRLPTRNGVTQLGAGSVDLDAALERACAGDEQAFRALTDPFRGELEFHCYRMLGSVQDAEDVFQETMLAAWRGLGGFERRSSMRTWLYRIATNRCLNVLRDARRRPQEAPALTFDIPAPTATVDPGVLDPYPDDRLGWLADSRPGPAARYEFREADELIFVGALQRLPAQQRAVLVLRDVLGFPTQDAAEILDTSADAVKSALKRARAALAREHGTGRERVPPPAPASAAERQSVDRFVEAFLADDVAAMTALITEDAWFRMPPAPHEYRGREAIGAFLAAVCAGHANQTCRVVATRANGQPALRTHYYLDRRSEPPRHSGLLVLSLAGEAIAGLTWFLGSAYLGPFEPSSGHSAPSGVPPVSENL